MGDEVSLKPPSEPLTLQSVAKAYTERDNILSPDVSDRCRMSKHIVKLGWHEESDSAYTSRKRNEAVRIFMNTVHDDSRLVSEIWDQATEIIVRRQEDPRVRYLIAEIEAGVPLEALYQNHFTLDELICLGW